MALKEYNIVKLLFLMTSAGLYAIKSLKVHAERAKNEFKNRRQIIKNGRLLFINLHEICNTY